MLVSIKWAFVVVRQIVESAVEDTCFPPYVERIDTACSDRKPHICLDSLLTVVEMEHIFYVGKKGKKEESIGEKKFSFLYSVQSYTPKISLLFKYNDILGVNNNLYIKLRHK